MRTNCEQIVQDIKEIQKRIERDESQGLLNHLKIGQQLAALKAGAPTTSKWREYRQQLGYDPRVADRYLKLGRSWWVNGGLQASGYLHQVSRDLLVLEYLCQLPKPDFVHFMNCTFR